MLCPITAAFINKEAVGGEFSDRKLRLNPPRSPFIKGGGVLAVCSSFYPITNSSKAANSLRAHTPLDWWPERG